MHADGKSTLASVSKWNSGKVNYQINSSVYVANGGHYYARLIKIHIHLIAFDRIVYREIQLIALTLMTFSKARASELRMVTRDCYCNDKAPFL